MGVADRLADRCAVVFHDVGLCGMDEGWEHIKRLARPMSLKPFDLTFTDYGLTVLLLAPPGQALGSSLAGSLAARTEVELAAPGQVELHELHVHAQRVFTFAVGEGRPLRLLQACQQNYKLNNC